MQIKKPKHIQLKYKLMISYLAIFIALALTIVIGNAIMNNRFNAYFKDRTLSEIETFIEAFSNSLAEGGTRDLDVFVSQLPEPIRFHTTFYDTEGTLVSESGEIFSSEDIKKEPGLPESPEASGFHQPHNDFMDRAQLAVHIEEIQVDEVTYGTMVVEYFDNITINSRDIDLVNQFTAGLRIALVIIALVGVLMSFFMARSITKPIKQVSKTANDIREGHLHARAQVDTNTAELLELSNTINYLADTLQHEEVLRSQMTSDMAHEIRTPLTTLRNFLEAFIDGVWEADDDKLNKCYSEVLRMNDLVDRLKDIANIEESNLRYNDMPLDFSTELTSIATLYKEQFEEHGIDYTIDIEDHIQATMDSHKLNQIFSNLISNSLRYTDPGGSTTLTCRHQDQEILVEVSDTGMGIGKKDLPYIFERFYRAEKSRSRASGGMGIGLTIVQKLVQSYQGTITVQSERDKGTTFTVTFPDSHK